VRRLVNWAILQGYISTDPLKGLQMPAATRREVWLTRDEFKRVLGAIREDWFRQLVTVAFETGCRPQEIFAVEARHFDVSNSRWVFPVPESKGKRQPRVVYLTPLAEQITATLIEKHPTGKLFRNAAGKPLRKVTGISAFYRLRRRLGRLAMEAQGVTRDHAANQVLVHRGDKRSLHELSAKDSRHLDNCAAAHFAPKICLYSMRHRFATLALQSGLDGLTVAILLGHKDTAMLARVYQHLAHNSQHLLGQVRRVLG
jgi:integrase